MSAKSHEIKDEIVHELKSPFEYATKGETRQAKRLFVKAPNNKIERWINEIQEEIAASQRNVLNFSKGNVPGTEEGPKKSDDTDGHIYEFTLMFGDKGTAQRIKNAFREILTSKFKDGAVCMVDGEERLTNPLYDEMSPHDTNMLLEAYIVNFINTSPKG